MRYKNFIWTACAAATLAVAGCSDDVVAERETPTEPVVEEPAEVKPLTLTAAEQQQVTQLNVFGDKLIAAVQDVRHAEDFSVSPTSYSIFLSMMANTADGELRAQLLQAMGAKDLATLNSLSKKLMDYLPANEDGAKLFVANKMWLSQKYEAPEAFRAMMSEVFSADVDKADFDSPLTKEIINRWVKDKTKGMISSILDRPWENYRLMPFMTVNAVYFNGVWPETFDVKNTVREPFNGTRGVKDVAMVQANKQFMYAAKDGVALVQLPFRNGTARLEVYLPDEGVSVASVAVNADLRKKLNASVNIYNVKLSLPRFETLYSIETNNDILSRIGVTAYNAADFSPVGVPGVSPFDLIHKTGMKLDEKGAKASAVTGNQLDILNGEGGSGVPFVTMNVNRPFFYIIRHISTGAILMAGSVSNING